MALRVLTRALGSLSLTPRIAVTPGLGLLPAVQVMNSVFLTLPSGSMSPPCRPILTSVALSAKFVSWKSRTKYTVMPVKMRKSGGRNHTGAGNVHSNRGPSIQC
uniref:Mitochondrial ribosomal protein L2 n=1 Tax=Catagonus wagneri TaxID=51154 RepID=A0A8C3X1N8_9CETA